MEIQQGTGKGTKGRKVVRCKNLTLDDGEVNLDLVQPAGMDWPVNQDKIGMASPEPLGSRRSSVSRTIIHDPEDPSSVAVGSPLHGLVHKPIERSDPVFRFAATEKFCPMNVPGRQVGPSAESAIFMLDSHSGTRPRGQGGVFPASRLDARLLVGAEDELIWAQPAALPMAVIEVENTAGFLSEVGVAGEYPATMLPGTDGILIEPPPDGGIADGCHETGSADMGAEFSDTPSRQRQIVNGGELTGESFDLNDDFWGKKAGDGRVVGGRRARQDVAQRSVYATC